MQNVIVTSIRNETVLKSVVSGSILIWCWVSGSVFSESVEDLLLGQWLVVGGLVEGLLVGQWLVVGGSVEDLLVVSGSVEDLSVGQWLVVGGGWPVGGR